MATFNGQLRPNEIFAALYNMIISQQVFADNIKGTYSSLVDKARVDGSLYGDTKLYYATDALESVEWLDDEEAANLLQLHRPEAPEVQAIVIDKFRQIRLTVDDYLSKRAWGTEGAFSSFMSIMKGWIRDTKRIYDSTLYNAFVGTAQSNEGLQAPQSIAVGEGENFGLAMAEALANLLVDLKDVSRDYNDYGNIRSFNEKELMVIWNAKYYNKIKKVDLPVVFHNNDLLNEFDQEVLPERYFGVVVGEAGTATTKADNTSAGTETVRSLVEKSFEVVSAEADPRAKLAKDGKYYVHVFPGDIIPNNVVFNQNEAYYEKQDIVFKVIHKRSIPYMSAFEVGTSFFNPRSLTTNHYLTFGHNTLEYLKNYPIITRTFTE